MSEADEEDDRDELRRALVDRPPVGWWASKLLRDRFELLERVGAGGMGEVWRAHDRETGATVAVKRLKRDDASLGHRFAREADLLARIDHPAVVRFVDRGVDEDGAVFLVMEWLEGEDLARRLQRGPLAPSDAILLMRRVCRALAPVHEHGVVHRDIKPSNVFLVGGEPARACVIDFGIARSADATRALTGAGALLGTLGYMAPEQARAAPGVDPRADVFSLGCVLFECLTGRPAFDGDHPAAILAQILTGPAPRVRDVLPGAPALLDELVAAMTQHAPEERPRDMRAVLDALDRCQDASTSPLEIASHALSTSEQRHVCVLLVTRPRVAPLADASTVDRSELDVLTPALRDLVRELGGTDVDLASDVALVVFDERAHGAGGGAATEVAVRAARCARALCELDASLVVAMGAGLARHEARGPVGSAVDRAASLLSDVAGERGVLLDSASARLLEARFEVTSRGAACVLGSERADVGFRRFLGRTSRFVGRRRELAFLSAAYEECCEERVGQAVLLVGEPGVGKSRLAHELEQRVEGATWLGARCDPVYADSAFALISRLITSALGAERLEPASLRAALGGRLDVEQSERAAVALGELLGVSAEGREVAAMGQHRRAVLALFETVAIDEPLVMMIEDVHWADPTSVELVQEIVAARRDRPTMLVATARPSVDVRFPRLWEGVALRRLAVEPLDDHAASRLAREVLGGSFDEAALARIVGKAGGNAFFLEELIRHVVEGAEGELPESVIAMAEARLRALGDDARRVLRAASVFGERFWSGAVRALLGAAPARELDALVAAEVIERSERSRFAGEDELAFRHGLLREAAHAALTPEDRALGHRLAAEWLEEKGEHEARVVAEHFVASGAPDRAAPWLLEAARAAFYGGQFREVARLAELGIACHPPRELEGRFWLLAAEACGWGEDVEGSIDTAERAIETSVTGSSEWFAALSIYTWGAVHALDTERIGRALGLLRGMEGELEAAPPTGLAVMRAINSITLLGERELAADLIERLGRAVDTASEDARPILEGYWNISRGNQCVFGLEDRGEAMARVDRARACFERANDPVGLMTTDYSEALVRMERGELDAAVPLSEAVERTARELGAFTLATMVRQFRSLALVSLRRDEEAEALMRESLASRNDFYRLQARTLLATLALRRGDVSAVDELRATFEEAGPLLNARIPAALALARVELAMSREDEARRYADVAEAALARAGGLSAAYRAFARVRELLGERPSPHER